VLGIKLGISKFTWRKSSLPMNRLTGLIFHFARLILAYEAYYLAYEAYCLAYKAYYLAYEAYFCLL
jgi:hypothetical protein